MNKIWICDILKLCWNYINDVAVALFYVKLGVSQERQMEGYTNDG